MTRSTGAAPLERARPLPRRRSALRENELRAVLVLGDAAAVALAAVLAPLIWGAFDPEFNPHEGFVVWQVGSVLVWVLGLYLLGGSDLAIPRFGHASVGIVAQALLAVTALALVAFFAFPFFTPRGATLSSIPMAAALVLAWRAAYLRAVSSEILHRRVAVLGTDHTATAVAEVMLGATGMPYRLVAFLATDATAPPSLLGVAVVQIEGVLWDRVRDLRVDQLIVGDLRQLDAGMTTDLVRCFEQDVEALPATVVYEQLTGRVMAAALEADWYGELPTHTRRVYIGVKHAIDLLMALVLGVVALPLLLVGIVGTLLTSGRPVLYRQVRVGQRGEPFVLHKLRTMRPDAEAEGAPVWASQRDQRAGRFGRWLRRTHIDELPQLWDVMRGKMSLVGPRPERPEFVDQLSAALPLYRARLLVRPGLTGWAQVQLGYAASVDSNLAKLEYDLYYLRHLGPVLDLSIALRTLGAIVRGR